MGKVYLDSLGGLPGAGAIPAKQMIVGIAPSTKRPVDRRLEPFGSASWSVIQKITQVAQGDLYVTNLIKDPMDPGSKVTVRDVRKWTAALEEEIALVKPERVLALGKFPAVALCPNFAGLREDHGTFFFNERFNFYAVPTYHFAAAFRDRRLLPFVTNDLRRFFTLPDPTPAKYKLLDLNGSLNVLPWERYAGRRIFLDVETTGVTMQDHITMLGFAWEGHATNYVVENPTSQWAKKFLHCIIQHKNTMVGHNLPFDVAMLMLLLDGKFPRTIPTEDTMLMAHAAGEEILSLKHLTSAKTNLPGSRSGGGYADPLYLAEDVRSTAAVYKVFEDRRGTFAQRLLSTLIVPVARMRVRGVYIDHARLAEIEAETKVQRESITTQLMKLNGRKGEFNPQSSVQTAEFLRRSGVKLTEKTDAGAWSVKEKTLLALEPLYPDNPAMKTLLAYRAAQKLLTGFIKSYNKFSAADGLLHPTLKLFGARTGRLSCSDPNLQQVPREGPLKLIFVPRPGFEALCLCDLSQAELRVAALIADDDKMVDALLSEDVHRRIASIVFHKPEKDITPQQRKWSKRITFGIIYGGSSWGLSATSGLPEEEVAAIIKMIRREFTGLDRWLIRSRNLAKTAEFVETAYGRRRSLTGIREHEGVGGAYRKIVNTPVQSLASDLILVVLHVVDEEIARRKLKTRPLFTVHDSLALEVGNGESEIIPEILDKGFKTIAKTPIKNFRLFERLPIIGDMALGDSWAACESTNEGYGPRVCYAFSTHSPAKRTSKK